jgi:hypothetical protein
MDAVHRERRAVRRRLAVAPVFNTQEGHILEATWNQIPSPTNSARDNNGFIEQLLDFSHKNEERVSMRIEEAKRCQIGQRQICR